MELVKVKWSKPTQDNLCWWLYHPCGTCKHWKEDDLSTEDDCYFSCSNESSDNYLSHADYIDDCHRPLH